MRIVLFEQVRLMLTWIDRCFTANLVDLLNRQDGDDTVSRAARVGTFHNGIDNGFDSAFLYEDLNARMSHERGLLKKLA